MRVESSPNLIQNIIKNDSNKKVHISENLKNEVNKWLETPLFKELKLTKEEVKKNFNTIEKIIEQFKLCSSLPDDKCCNKDGNHLALKRANNGKIFLTSIPCEKLKKYKESNKFKENYLIYHFDKKNMDIRLNGNYFNNKMVESKLKLMKKLTRMVHEKDELVGLYIHGSTGIGKTYSCIAFANELARKNKTIAFVFVPELVYILKNNFDEIIKNRELIDKLRNVDVLFLDDIGAEEANSWFYGEYLLIILNYRMSNNKPTFFISNLSLNRLEIKMMSLKKFSNMNAKRLMERIRALTLNKEFYIKDKNLRY